MPASADPPPPAGEGVPVQQPAPWLPHEAGPPPLPDDFRTAVRETDRKAAEASNRGLDYATSEDEARRRFARWRTWDPFPEIDPALLNAADIADYARTTAMIYPFDPAELKPASQMIALEGEYLYFDGDGKQVSGHVLPTGHPRWDEVENPTDQLLVPGNSIVFVTVESLFQVPDYMAMRFNLKIDHVYKGLLLGTGPLVDPGFVGRLHIPLHNLTVEDYSFRAGDGLIWVEFTKLSRNRLFDPRAADSAERRGRYTFFKASKSGSGRTVGDYIREGAQGGKPRSSIPDAVTEARAVAQKAAAAVETGLQETAKLAEAASTAATASDRRITNWTRGFTLAGVLTVVGALLAIVLPTIGLVQDSDGRYRDLSTQLQEQQAEIERLRQEVARLEAQPAVPPAAPSVQPTADPP